MHKDFDNQRELTPDEIKRRAEVHRKDQADQAGYGQVGGVAQDPATQYGLKQGVNRLMDKRIVQSVLHQRASELRAQADGLERLSELIGAAATHDMTLFSIILTLVERR